ncbi:MAG: nucleotidyltransferase domain-containing protein [Deltaproteobacteria bacterium]|nr:nucleotidyltransferase domain-containing protein [Deltaproteobacteria bacterium]MBI3294800.1 nucleotidyltransferase domain-containing protein [Deltaproteobacteria bacterium]
MSPHFQIGFDRNDIAKFCKKWGVKQLSLFGSVLRADFSNESDIDVLLTFEPLETPSLFDFVELKEDLAEVFGNRSIDVLTRYAVENSANDLRKEQILSTALPIYDEAA